jgi:hypothetical protein
MPMLAWEQEASLSSHNRRSRRGVRGRQLELSWGWRRKRSDLAEPFVRQLMGGCIGLKEGRMEGWTHRPLGRTVGFANRVERPRWLSRLVD